MGSTNHGETTIYALAKTLSYLLPKCLPRVPGSLRVVLIANPHAGGLKRPAFCNEVNNRLLELAPINDGEVIEQAISVHITKTGGHAVALAKELVADCTQDGGYLVLISVGGDGTHNECLTGLMSGDPHARSRTFILRVPAGTGNDAADAPSFHDLMDALVHGDVKVNPRSHEEIRAIEVQGAQGPSRWAFNIASAGLDAFVVHLTNVLKSFIPGSFYRLFADLAVLFYISFLKPSTLVLQTQTKEDTSSLTGTFGIIVLGVSGKRMYGHGLMVLPHDNNFCAIKRSSLPRNIALKTHLYHGTHGSLPETTMGDVDELHINTNHGMWVQVDGEVFRLEPHRGKLCTMTLRGTGIRRL